MNAQLFVRMPTKYCDYTQVLMPSEMKNFNLCNGCIMRAYDAFAARGKDKFLYLLCDCQTQVLAGAWVNIEKLVNDNMIDVQYKTRQRNHNMAEPYYAFVGFLLEKEVFRGNVVSIFEHDIISVFNQVVERIWGRDSDKVYVAERATYPLYTTNGEVGKKYTKYLSASEKTYIKDSTPTINLFNGLLNGMLQKEQNTELVFCSGFKNKRGVIKSSRFDIGCKYKENCKKIDILQGSAVSFGGDVKQAEEAREETPALQVIIVRNKHYVKAESENSSPAQDDMIMEETETLDIAPNVEEILKNESVAQSFDEKLIQNEEPIEAFETELIPDEDPMEVFETENVLDEEAEEVVEIENISNEEVAQVLDQEISLECNCTSKVGEVKNVAVSIFVEEQTAQESEAVMKIIDEQDQIMEETSSAQKRNVLRKKKKGFFKKLFQILTTDIRDLGNGGTDDEA